MIRKVRSRLFLARRRLVEWCAHAQRTVPGSAVALTFDDGPHPSWTPEVLRVLREHDVRATFFLVGSNAARYPDLVMRIAADGHAVGSHSATHRVDGGRRSWSAIRDFRIGRRLVEHALGRPVMLFRPPHGRLNALTATLCRLSGFSTWLWSVEADDWVPGTESAALVQRYSTRSSGGAVLLMHDWIEEPLHPSACDRSALLGALPPLIAMLRISGMHFVTLEEE